MADTRHVITPDYTLYVTTATLGGVAVTNDGLQISDGSATSTSANKLVDTAATFTTAKHNGMTVYNSTDDTWAKVSAVDDANTLSLNVDIMASGESYVVVAAKTLAQEAIDSVSGKVFSNVEVKMSDDTFAEAITIKGKRPTGDYNITIKGTDSVIIAEDTVSSATSGSRTVHPTLTVGGTPYTANAHIGQWVRFEDDTTTAALQGQKHQIYHNTTSVLTMRDGWAASFGVTPANTDTFKIVDCGTDISEQLLVKDGQKAVVLDNIHFSKGSHTPGVMVSKYSSVVTQYCHLTAQVTSFSTLELLSCFMNSANIRQLYAVNTSAILLNGIILDGVNASAGWLGIDVAALSSIATATGAYCNIINGDIAGGAKNFTDGLLLRGNAYSSFWANGQWVKSIIENCIDGIHAKEGAQMAFSAAAYIAYTNNTTDTNPDDGGVAYTFGKIG